MLHTVADVVTAVNAARATADPSAAIAGISTDSRRICAGDVFVALHGEHHDGHDHAASAVQSGAIAVVVDHEIDGLPCIVVPDTLTAYGDIAAEHLRRLRAAHDITVIGITGSSGKTSAKDLIAQVLEPVGPVVAPGGSMNNEIGVPATVLRADASTRVLVLEMGMRGLGQIAYLCRMAPPDISVLLNIGMAHIGELGSQDAIQQAKSEIIEGLKPGGTAVLNGDDWRIRASASRAPHDSSVLWFGTDNVDVRASEIRLDAHGHAAFTLTVAGEQHGVTLQVLGEHQVSNALAAAGVAHRLGVAPARIASGLSSAQMRSRWRMEVHETADGITVINDAYNANPESMRAGLKALAGMAGARRTWAVLGEMLELGQTSIDEHDSIGRLAVRLDINHLVVVGEGARPIHMGAAHEGSWGQESVWVPDVDAALAHLREHLASGDIVLIKASRSIGLERVADTLLAERGTVAPS